ncbi:hypothetical protein SKAU_G00187030 [Synaphobranchus kaupii]|uniref:Uncharacterized protein n=1 Tax=Synaphobranchus kaupii TaxID=118154 RepID=A0A9Q1FCX4_SYNKA|nr:hypothetical protein SKAU_G00187030 [Synaphobranchus kaupii]
MFSCRLYLRFCNQKHLQERHVIVTKVVGRFGVKPVVRDLQLASGKERLPGTAHLGKPRGDAEQTCLCKSTAGAERPRSSL